jgi:vacuolar-type H+-ATPase subunit F/Vma7
LIDGVQTQKKLAVIAGHRTATVFKLAGLPDVYAVNTTDEADARLRTLIETPGIVIILIAEPFLQRSMEFVKDNEDIRPVIIPIPSLERRTKVELDLVSTLVKSKAGVEFNL